MRSLPVSFSVDLYTGFEIEINQRLLMQIQGTGEEFMVFPDEIKDLAARSLLLAMRR